MFYRNILRMTITALFILNIPLNLFAQEDDELSHILRAYPDWKTNFDKRAIDISELISGGPPKDGIPAIIKPKLISIEEASDWLDDVEPVIAVEINGEAKAYALSILIWHEIANDEVGGVPVVVSFCPLCYSGVVFNRKVHGVVPYFGVSGLLRNSDMVMYDDITESFWQQFTGEAIVGDMVGTELEIIPSQIISFAQFKEAYPNGLVLSKETGLKRAYGLSPYIGYDDIDQQPFLYKGEIDERLPPNEKVIGIKDDGMHKAYPYTITMEKHVINDVIDGKPVVVFHSKGATSALDGKFIADSKEVGSTGAFSRVVDGKTLTFKYDEDSNLFIDNETNSRWNVLGQAIEGNYKGKQLTRLLAGDYFAFAWFAFVPDTEVYSEAETEE